MASFDNFTPIDQPWMFKSTFTDPFYPDSFARETESALTLALQQSLFGHPGSNSGFLNPGDLYSTTSTYNNINITSTGGIGNTRGVDNSLPGPNQVIIPDSDRNINRYSPLSANTSTNTNTNTAPSASTVTGSGSVSGSGSDPETPGSKRSGLGVVVGKTTKRKSRARSRATTTFIQTDQANFRRMVQEVTGGKLGDGVLPEFTVVKPEPHRQPLVNKLQGLLPTLDTSAYLLDVQNVNVNVNARRNMVAGGFPVKSPVTENGGVGVGADFYSCSSFPTLESSI